MSETRTNKRLALPLADVLARAKLGPGPGVLVAGLSTIDQVITALAGAGFGVEATRVVAHALPKREAVWWAAMCTSFTAPADLPPPNRAAVDAAQAWVRQPVQDAAYGAQAAAQLTNLQSPEYWAAMAAFWGGESLSQPGLPPVPPPPHLPGVAVAGAVVLASVRGDAQRQPQRVVQFLHSAYDIAAGGSGRLNPEAA